MIIKDISKVITAKVLNENLAKKFGTRIKLEQFSMDQLYDARNKLRTELSQIETNESYDSVNTNTTYQKNKLFLDVLNAEISERSSRSSIQEKITKSSSASDIVSDFVHSKNKKFKGKSKKERINMALGAYYSKHPEKSKRKIKENVEDQAEIVMAAKDMVARLTGWMEDTAQMETESVLKIGDSIRSEMGNGTSANFIEVVRPALEELYSAMENTRVALVRGVTILTGEEEPLIGNEPETEPSQMPPEGEAEMGPEPEMEPTVDQEDEFAAATAGGPESAGRAKRESIERFHRLNYILSSQKKK